MSVVAAAMKELIELGVTGDALVAAVERIETAAYGGSTMSVKEVVNRSARAERNRRYYEAQRLKASEIKTVKTLSDDIQTSKTVSDASKTPPRAHVRDITSNLDTTGKITSEAKASSVRVLTTAKPNGFALFWEAYPSKVGKRDAEKAYERAMKRIAGPDPPNVVMAGVARAKTSRKWRDGFIPNPATWLNRDGWEDQPEPDRSHERSEQPSPKLIARHENFARSFRGAQLAVERRALEREGGS